MEVNTVCINTEEYLDLIKFKEHIESGSTFIVRSHGLLYVEKYITTDEAIKSISLMNQSLVKRIEELEQMKEPKYVSNFDLKRMSIWQLIKWRKK